MSHAELIQVRMEGTETTISILPQHLNELAVANEVEKHLRELIEETQLYPSGPAETPTVRLDFEKIQRLGSLGLNQLISIQRAARNRGVRLVLTNVQQSVQDVFVVTRLERMFEIFSV